MPPGTTLRTSTPFRPRPEAGGDGAEEEIRHITGSWQTRHNELRITTDADTKALMEAEKVKLVGYRDLAKLWTAGKK